MVTLLVPVQKPSGEGSVVVDLDHTFDEVREKLTPEEPPADVAAYRRNLTFKKIDGKQVFIAMPSQNYIIEEH